MPHKDAMNQLNISLQHSITTVAAHGWSRRRIARELDLNRETVGKYLRLADSKPAIASLCAEAGPAAKPAISTAGSGRQSSCLPWQPQLAAAVTAGLSARVAGPWQRGRRASLMNLGHPRQKCQK